MCTMKVSMGPSLLLLLLLLTSLTDSHDVTEKYVKLGEMVALHCSKTSDSTASNVTWTSGSSLQEDLSQMSAAEQREAEVLLYQDYFVIFRASENHQGNYSCTVRDTNQQMWFSLMIQEHVDPSEYFNQICSEQESCTIRCPVDSSVPENLNNSISWNENGVLVKEDIGFFPSVNPKNNEDLYNCTRSYQYEGGTYNMSFTVRLIVEPQEGFPTYEKIISPKDKEVIYVELGQTAVITCEADARVFWKVGDGFVEGNESFRIYSNSSSPGDLNAKSYSWLIFKNVLEEDLSKNYTCKLESLEVTITLSTKVHMSYVPLALSIVGIIVLMVVAVAIYMKFKIEIRLHLRDTLGCHRQYSDAKEYDAFLLSYKCDSDPGLKENDRKWLQNILEEKFGYNLCVFDRDVLPGEAVAQAVVDYIEQSRAVVLIPSTVDPGLGSSLPSTIHEALVERKANLIFLKTRATKEGTASLSGSVELLREPGHCVEWEGLSSMQPSSSFWKQLRYRLPASSASRESKTMNHKMQNPCQDV